MKKTKFLKVLAPIVALGLLIGALVGVSASANETAPASDVAPEIISMNVEYGSELYLYYAVDKATVTEAPVLEVLDAEGNVIETVEDYYDDTILGGKEVYVFKAPGTAPKDIGIMQNVRVVSGEAVGAVKSASIEGYLYMKLYKEGYIAKADDAGKDYTRRNLYLQLLKYARAAQEIFSAPGFVPVGGAGLYVVGAEGIVSGKYVGTSDVIALNAKAVEGKTFSYWDVQIVSPTGKVVESRRLADGYELIVDENSIIALPAYNADSLDGVEAWDKSALHFNYMPKNILFSSNTTEADRSIATDPTDPTNRVLQIGCNGITHSIEVRASDIPADANAVIGEVKIYLGGKGSNGSGYIGQEFFLGIPGTSHYTSHYSFFIASSGKIDVYQAEYNDSTRKHASTMTLNSSNIAWGEWVTFRFEYRVLVDEETGLKTPEWKIFVNDEFIGTWKSLYGYNYLVKDESGNTGAAADVVVNQSNIPDPKGITKFSINTSSSNKSGFVYFDDFSIKHIVE